MEKNKIKSLPEAPWRELRLQIKSLGEGLPLNKTKENFIFLNDLEIVDNTNKLTVKGRLLFEEAFIRKNSEREWEILLNALLNHPAAQALQQYLWGMENVSIEQVITTLRATGFLKTYRTATLTHFLDLLNSVGFLCYNKKRKKVRILLAPSNISAPKNIFISPERPFSNIMWMKKVLSECKDFIYWLDKHFQKEGLEWLWSVADANKIKEIRILSLNLGESNLNTEAKEMYSRLKRELQLKGISILWKTIESTKIRDQHDRWIIGKDYLRNLPNVNAINAGQRSEIISSDNYKDALAAFEKYWKLSQEII